MSAFVKLPSSSGIGSYLGIPSNGKGLFKPTKDSMGLRSPAAVEMKEEDFPIDKDSIGCVKLNQTVKLIPPVALKPRRYTVILGFNPKLAAYGTVSNPGIFAEGDEICMYFKANKNVDLKELDYVFTYYMID